MFRALVGLVFLISCLHSPSVARGAEAGGTFKVSTPASEVFKAQKDIIDFMKGYFPEVEVDVVWQPCGQRNAFYLPSEQKIVLCTEMEEFRSAAILFAAHEMGHAITMQLLDEGSEYDADELAALAMIAHDEITELAEASLYWKKRLVQGHIVGDPHGSAGYRSWFFICMASGVDAPGECRNLLLTTAWKWEARLYDYR